MLNLLVAFDALLTERSVTRAAARVGLGQSAMSHNLARLRSLFGDELLTRGPEGMRPTPRALALVNPVRIALSDIAALVVRADKFDPRTAERVFRIGLPDSVEVLVGPKLLARVCAEAPGIRFRFYSTDALRLLDEIDADNIDLGIGIGTFPEGQTHHKRRILATETYLCMFNAERVGIAPPISLADYVRLPHVLTSLRKGERGVVDDALAKLGLSRQIALTTPRFVAVPFLVAGAPVITTMHARLARYFADELGLALSPPPVALPRSDDLAALARLLRRRSRQCLAPRDGGAGSLGAAGEVKRGPALVPGVLRCRTTPSGCVAARIDAGQGMPLHLRHEMLISGLWIRHFALLTAPTTAPETMKLFAHEVAIAGNATLTTITSVPRPSLFKT